MLEATNTLLLERSESRQRQVLHTSVTVTIAAHGGADRLQRCLQSLATQSLPPQEILVMPCSTSSQMVTRSPATGPVAFGIPPSSPCRLASPRAMQRIAGTQSCPASCVRKNAAGSGPSEARGGRETSPPAPPVAGGSGFTIVAAGQPMSYAAAQNRLIQQTQTDVVCCLNDDVVLGDRYLEIAMQAFARDLRIGMVTGKILRPDGRTLDGAGQCVGRTRKAVDRGYRRRDRGQFDRPEYVFGPGGAAPLFRRQMLEAIALRPGEYFDEAFGMYYEDLDLAWRAQRTGWRAYYAPAAVAYHERGASSGIRHGRLRHRWYLPQLSERWAELAVLNRYRAMRRNDTWPALLRDLPAILAFELCQWGYLACRSPRLFLRCARQLPRLSGFRHESQVTSHESRFTLTHTAA